MRKSLSEKIDLFHLYIVAWLNILSYFTCIISSLCNGKFTVVEKSDKAYSCVLH